jgi:hypothetical protein
MENFKKDNRLVVLTVDQLRKFVQKVEIDSRIDELQRVKGFMRDSSLIERRIVKLTLSNEKTVTVVGVEKAKPTHTISLKRGGTSRIKKQYIVS